MPPPISQTEIERYASLLDLSDPQIHFLSENFKHYEAHAKDILGLKLPELTELALEGGDAAYPTMSMNAAQIGLRLAQEERKFSRRLRDFEDELFGQLQTSLSDSQLEMLIRVKARRQRECCILLDSRLGQAKIDLTFFIERNVGITEFSQATDQLLQEYEALLTPLVVKLDKLLYFNRTDGRILEIDGTQASRALMLQKIGPQAQLQRRIVDLNDEYVKKIALQMSPSQSKRLIAIYQVEAYPIIYPDTLFPADIVTKVLDSTFLSPEDHENLQQKWGEFQREHDDLGDKMVETFKDHRERLAATSVVSDLESYRLSMRSLRDRRWELDKRFVDNMIVNVPPELRNWIDQTLRQYRASCEQTVGRGQTDGYPSA